MAFKYLFIIESPGKTKKIQSFLGSEYKVLPTVGHILDLPAKGLNVDINNDFKPTYKTIPGKESVVADIKKNASQAEKVYIGTDLDREGEMIAQSVFSILPSGIISKRVKYGAITKNEILRSIEEASDIDNNLVNSAECRRIIDRIAGYKTSFITTQATGGKSAGRTQSAGLKILAEREKQIRDFVPKEYWPIEVTLERENGERVVAIIKSPKTLEISNGDEASGIIDELKANKWKVSSYEVKEKSNKAYPPFTTSTLYQSASSILGWSSSKTASVAQKLYENSLLTYIRSDSTFIIPDKINEIRGIIPNKYGASYLPDNANYFSNKQNAQEAHEAIRVIDVNLENISTSSADERRLYEIVWKKTVSSQMSNMIQSIGKAEFECSKYVFGVSGSKILFDGWYKTWNYGNFDDSILPEFNVGEELRLIDIKTEQKFTQPPNRYSEASFIKELEKLGIGRPSTYKTIISTLLDRKYIVEEKKSLHVTDMGIRVSDFLVEANMCFVDTCFTSDMENDLDCIAKGDCEKLNVLSDFWNRLKEDIDRAKNIRKDISNTEFKCPKCGGILQRKFSKYGEFLSCSNRTNESNPCDYKCSVDEDGNPVENKKTSIELEESNFTCPNCGEKLLVRTSKKNSDYHYLGCKNWQDKKCRGFYNVESGEPLDFSKKKSYKKKYYKKK